MLGNIFKIESNSYPAIMLKKSLIFPSERVPIILEGGDVISSVSASIKERVPIVLTFQKNGDYSQVGVVANVIQSWFLGPMVMGIVVEGLARVKIRKFFIREGTRMADVEEINGKKESGEEELQLEALGRSVLDKLKKLLHLEGMASIAAAEHLQKDYLAPELISDIASFSIKMSFSERVALLETIDVKKRLEILNSKLTRELDIAQTEIKIQKEVSKEVGKAQRDFVLQERLKAIEKELGIYEEQKEFEQMEQKIRSAAMPENIEKMALKEVHRLRRMPLSSAEVPSIRTYLEWIIDLPWSNKSKSFYDLGKAGKILDQDHYGLEKAKERVLEYLAVQKLTEGKGRGNIMCFVGPPGTGKTSVGKSIAKAVGRNFVRVSLGGIRDEAEIRGHRRTYVGALPGRIIQGMKTAGAKNPVFMLDEIDKLGTDFHGDPSSALLEVLDPEQNSNFSDHYLEVPFDLSEVFFIATANLLDPIPPALRDRMEVIEFPGYTDYEKFEIAKKFILAKVTASHGLSRDDFEIKDGAVRKIIGKYTREAGVRNLERKMSEIARKIAKKITEGKWAKGTLISESNLSDYLGPGDFEITMREEKDEVGVATGLAWTSAGGEIMFVEVALSPGKGVLTITGQLGDVMQESARAALSYIRSRSGQLGFDPDFYHKSDVHIHVPSGAIPKDGPSSGIAIATALASILTKREAKKEVALTGEITLTGKILPVGGVKEKVLAAHRAGVETIVLPKGNNKNIAEIPEQIKKDLKFKFVKHMDEVISVALK